MIESFNNLHQKEYPMHNEFASVIEQDGDWFIGYSPEIPGANGQGRSVEECRANLAEAIALILEDRHEDGLRGAPQGFA
jgi:predicted RNase H-like HicB family nuclease